jgi:hypothetical protein
LAKNIFVIKKTVFRETNRMEHSASAAGWPAEFLKRTPSMFPNPFSVKISTKLELWKNVAQNLSYIRKLKNGQRKWSPERFLKFAPSCHPEVRQKPRHVTLKCGKTPVMSPWSAAKKC